MNYKTVMGKKKVANTRTRKHRQEGKKREPRGGKRKPTLGEVSLNLSRTFGNKTKLYLSAAGGERETKRMVAKVKNTRKEKNYTRYWHTL